MSKALRELYALAIRLAKGSPAERQLAALISEAVNVASHCHKDERLAQTLQNSIAKFSFLEEDAANLALLTDLLQHPDFVMVMTGKKSIVPGVKTAARQSQCLF